MTTKTTTQQQKNIESMKLITKEVYRDMNSIDIPVSFPSSRFCSSSTLLLIAVVFVSSVVV